MVRLVSGDNHTTYAALPPSDANQQLPCAKLKNVTSQVRYKEIAGTLKLTKAEQMNQRNNATAPSEIAPNQQTGELDGIN